MAYKILGYSWLQWTIWFAQWSPVQWAQWAYDWNDQGYSLAEWITYMSTWSVQNWVNGMFWRDWAQKHPSRRYERWEWWNEDDDDDDPMSRM